MEWVQLYLRDQTTWFTPLLWNKLLIVLFPAALPSLPLPLLRHGTSTTMADKDKRRPGLAPPAMPEGKATKSDSDREFLSQAGVGELLRGAILKMVEARSDDPIGFLADHFCNLSSMTESGSAGGCDAEPLSNAPPSAGAQEQQHLNRALWHLRLAHHSQRFPVRTLWLDRGFHYRCNILSLTHFDMNHIF